MAVTIRNVPRDPLEEFACEDEAPGAVASPRARIAASPRAVATIGAAFAGRVPDRQRRLVGLGAAFFCGMFVSGFVSALVTNAEIPMLSKSAQTATIAAPLSTVPTIGHFEESTRGVDQPMQTTDTPSSEQSARQPQPTGYRGSLAVVSTPAGADVFVNGELAGQTPLVLRSLRVGSRAVRLELDDHAPWSGSVRIVANERARVSANLRRPSS